MIKSKYDRRYRQMREQVGKYLETQDGKKRPWAEFLLVAPDLFYLMVKLLGDERVPRTQKLKLGAAVIYFLSPIDLLPEAILGPIGYLDDVAVAAFALHSVINQVDEAVVREHWIGQGDVLEVVQKILHATTGFLGGRWWAKLRGGAK